MTDDLAARFRHSLAALLPDLDPSPPTPIPSPQGGGGALDTPSTGQTQSEGRFPPPLWGREREGGRAPGQAGLGIAVSGGGDSLALLHLAAGAGLHLRAVTVDHGLRPEAAQEARFVAGVCQGLGLVHDTLNWHWDGTGNLQDAARRGRRGLIGDWARGAGLRAVLLAHTQDDVAETFLMRLARGAGVDGLSAMAGVWHEAGITWARPLLTLSRAELRHWLTARGLAWVEDPSNANPRFDRVKARRALAHLSPLGLGPQRLAEVAQHLAQARQALEQATDAAWARCLQDHGLALRLDPQALSREPAEIGRRLVQRLILHIAPAPYPPRGAEVQRLLARLMAGQGGTLAGCRFAVLKSGLWACREARALTGLVAGPDEVWDGKWQIAGPWPEGALTRALGEAGLAQCPDWRATGLPRAALIASPALWVQDVLVAAPGAGFGPAQFRLLPQFAAGPFI